MADTVEWTRGHIGRGTPTAVTINQDENKTWRVSWTADTTYSFETKADYQTLLRYITEWRQLLAAVHDAYWEHQELAGRARTYAVNITSKQ